MKNTDQSHVSAIQMPFLQSSWPVLPSSCPAATIPTAVITPPSQTVSKNANVTLSAASSHSNPPGDALGFTWVQLSGPAVTLSAPDSATTTFQAPNVAANTGLTFQVTVQDLLTQQSAVATTLVIVTPGVVRPDTVAITSAVYKANRGVLNVSATSSDASCAAVLTIQALASSGAAPSLPWAPSGRTRTVP